MYTKKGRIEARRQKIANINVIPAEAGIQWMKKDERVSSSAVLVAFIGTSCGITVGYFLGKAYGHPFLEKYSARVHIKRKLYKAEKWYSRYGKFALFIGYFIPGVRHFTAIFAGIALMPYRVFAVFAYGSGLCWTLTLASLGYFLGKNGSSF